MIENFNEKRNHKKQAAQQKGGYNFIKYGQH